MRPKIKCNVETLAVLAELARLFGQRTEGEASVAWEDRGPDPTDPSGRRRKWHDPTRPPGSRWRRQISQPGTRQGPTQPGGEGPGTGQPPGEAREGAEQPGGHSLPDWAAPVPGEEVLFAPGAVRVPLSDDDLRHRITASGRDYFEKVSLVPSGQAASEVAVARIARLAGIVPWPDVRAFGHDEPEMARVVQPFVPGEDLPPEEDAEGLRGALLGVDLGSVADALLLEFVVLAGDRHSGNYRTTGGRLVGVDYQWAFDPGWPSRYGVVWRNLPDELLGVPLNLEAVRAILEHRDEILALVYDEVGPHLDTEGVVVGLPQVGPAEAVALAETRLAALEGLLALGTPTLADLRAIHPDRPEE